MTPRLWLRRARRALVVAAAAVVTGGVVIAGNAAPAAAAGTGPCDIYAAGGTPCVAAHSTTRALFGAYSGRLYQVKRASDGRTTDVGTLSAGGFANAATQDSFCAGTSCTITIIYDQTARHNDLTQAPAGGAAAGPDALANASALPVTAGGHKVYGVFVAPGVGYRNDLTSGIATGSASQGEYMVAAGGHVNSGCCFDYGNAETNARDNGNGHMGAVYFGKLCWFGGVVAGQCSGTGPWVMADLENGLFAGANGTNLNNTGRSTPFVTGMVKMSSTTYAIKDGNADTGGLKTDYSGALPTTAGYTPLHLEGGIILGIGGDNSKGSAGSFFEGVMTSGLPSDATENAVQANITSVGYSLSVGTTATGPIVAGDNASVCLDNNVGAATLGNKVQMWMCDGNVAAQNWTVAANGTLQIDGGCLDITNASTANGTLIEWWTCNGGANQQWQSVNGELLNPASGKCLDDPGSNTVNGTQLILFTCNGGLNQQWHLP
ncbi:MAG TPA: arabinofuranosidase catalytic domain-containing protein [Pseudonocardiaceae bacterium]|nr:arabinofuranosidase catalytic domain-containing protein [Pseudonocardiaceae bacterium]